MWAGTDNQAAWTYDSRGRVTSEFRSFPGGGSKTTTWTSYNSADQPLEMVYPDSETLTMTYNVQMAAESLVGTQTYVNGVSYDAAGRVRLRSLGDNLQTEYTYNAWSQQGGRLSWLKSGPTGSPEALQKLAYGYDAGGNVTSIRDYLAATPYEELVYGYDALNRLAGVSGGLSESYTYDANTGNLASKTGMGSYGYNDSAHKHAVTHLDGGLKYTYDANGNMTQRVVGGHTYILIYDAENRLVEVLKDSVTIATFVYDADGRRVKGVVAGHKKC